MKYSFKDILEKEICIDEKENKYVLLSEIEIPMIQRDYAQGRKNAKEVRNRFLSSIFEALEKKENLILDFVYGSINEGVRFLLLDGQQRLTTLFLLYWYIASRELQSEDKAKIMNLLLKFTYATRDSASRFCKNIATIEETDTNEPGFFDITPQERLRNLPWFFLSYEKDPTVKSMFTMLDAIHEKYNESENKSLFDSLQNITFYILLMNGFNLTDELYVKMNARGKQLTDFENFKADLIKWMKAENNPHKDIYNEDTELDGRIIRYYMSFSQKMDVDWAKFFWTYSKTETDEKDKVPDRFLLNFFNRYLFNLFVVGSKDSQDEIQQNDLFNYFYGASGDDSELTYCSFKEYQTLLEEKNIIHNIEKCLDCFKKHYASIRGIAQTTWGSDWDFFQTKLDNLSQRVIFLALTLFIEKNEINDDFPTIQFKQWMRVVWNIVENTDNRIAQIIPAMRLINELAEYAPSIYEHLKDRDIKENSFANEQMKEEKEKARKILEDSSWEDKIIETEKYAFFNGSIRFLFTDRKGNYNWDLFAPRYENAQKFFDKDGVSPEYRENARLVCTFI
ncbi:MAG: DUF262 domain-containing protein, partial [Bacteroidales bacterium]|nr:DUF262 domain-containing protein [Bacteroidales bacterium]